MNISSRETAHDTEVISVVNLPIEVVFDHVNGSLRVTNRDTGYTLSMNTVHVTLDELSHMYQILEFVIPLVGREVNCWEIK